jgi:hypothetical protein
MGDRALPGNGVSPNRLLVRIHFNMNILELESGEPQSRCVKPGQTDLPSQTGEKDQDYDYEQD